MLSNFQIAGKPLLQSFLLGQNELNAIIQSPHMEQFRQRIIASSNLSSLSEEDCQAYIEYRIKQAGVSRPLLDQSCFAGIYRFTNGIPRKINNLLDRILLFGYLEDKTLLQQADVDEVITEISGEVAQRQPAQPMQSAPVQAAPPQTQAMPVAEQVGTAASANPYHAMLAELSGLLDSSLEHKIKMAKELDTLLNQQHQQVMRKLEDDKGS
jgi:hypothetical protein